MRIVLAIVAITALGAVSIWLLGERALDAREDDWR